MRATSGNRSRGGIAASKRGFTLIEVLIALVVLVFSLGAMARAIATSGQLSSTNRERVIALAAARQQLEQMQAFDFDQIFVRFNADPADDPGGPGTAEGANFEVGGLTPQEGDADGMTGEIMFPVDPLAPGELREDVNAPHLGMPADLNQDAAVDALDHAADYQRLPVMLRISWRGATGNRKLDLRTVLVNRP